MVKIKSLKGVDFDIIYEGFKKAFQDYEIQLNQDELKSMLLRRGFVPELSFAAFDKDEMVAFTLNGIGEFQTKKTAYDTGTGTIETYRGRGLASEIFEYSIPHLKAAGVQHYLLEVLQHNTKAVSIYEKLGFKVSREFNYFVANQNDMKFDSIKPLNPIMIKQIDLNQCKTCSFEDFHSSWQNSFDAISRDPSRFIYLGAFKSEELVGFCIFEPSSGDITQIGVNPSHRRQGIGSHLLKEALKFNRYDSIKVINTEIACESINKFMAYHSVPLSGKQFEMIRKI